MTKRAEEVQKHGLCVSFVAVYNLKSSEVLNSLHYHTEEEWTIVSQSVRTQNGFPSLPLIFCSSSNWEFFSRDTKKSSVFKQRFTTIPP